jgi:hypothetical protein
MKTHKISVVALFATIIMMFGSCSDNNNFVVSGIIQGGAGKTVYFENITASNVIVKDSCTLKSDAAFRFSCKRPDAPDFYRLRLDGQSINLAIDSTEHIIIEADTVSFARNYSVAGSEESSTIKTLTFAQLTANADYSSSLKKYQSGEISLEQFQVSVQNLTDRYKQQAREVILADPATGAAYFALFQKINNMLIFDPYDREDSRIFGAVANLWNLHYPDASRTKHLVQLFTGALKIMRSDSNLLSDKEIDSQEYFDISLPSINDSEVRLSQVGAGKVVLLDFTAYSLDESPAHNEFLATLYRKYYSRGFDIYQVSLDEDRHFWKNAASNLPWTCVVDPQSLYSETARRYNVEALPACFLIDRKGTLASRLTNLDRADSEIQKIIAGK